jgi:hypothetical protein
VEREPLIAAVWAALKDGPELAAIECQCPHKQMRIVAAVVDRVLWQQTQPELPREPVWQAVARVQQAVAAAGDVAAEDGDTVLVTK